MRQTAPAMADEGVCRMKQLMRKTRTGDKVAHQNEQRNDGQGVGKTSFLHHLSSTGQCRHPTAREANTHHAHQAHGKGQRHAQER